MQCTDAVSTSFDITPHLRQNATRAVRYYKGMYVMHMERFRELHTQYLAFTLRGEIKRAAWAYEDAHAIAREARHFLRLRHATEKRLEILGGAIEIPRDPYIGKPLLRLMPTDERKDDIS